MRKEKSTVWWGMLKWRTGQLYSFVYWWRCCARAFLPALHLSQPAGSWWDPSGYQPWPGGGIRDQASFFWSRPQRGTDQAGHCCCLVGQAARIHCLLVVCCGTSWLIRSLMVYKNIGLYLRLGLVFPTLQKNQSPFTLLPSFIACLGKKIDSATAQQDKL